jgi:uncharacterized protein (TIGR03086 family)
MTEVSERYKKNAAAFNARVEAVPADKWSNQSPCDDWTARDVVGHVVQTSGMFLGFVDLELPPAPSVDDDPVAAFHSARDAIQAALEDPATAAKEFDGFTGRSTFEAGVDRFLAPDALVHTWDLARAAELDENLDEAEAERVLAGLEQFGEAMRSPGAFGPAVEPPPGADAQTRLLCFAGRQP